MARKPKVEVETEMRCLTGSRSSETVGTEKKIKLGGLLCSDKETLYSILYLMCDIGLVTLFVDTLLCNFGMY